MSKWVALTAAATGYVLGARAGRERYEQIKTQATRVWQSPRVQQGVQEAEDVAARQAAVVKDKVTAAAKDAASEAVAKVRGASDTATATGAPDDVLGTAHA